jgi:hypothetical protein
VSTENEVPQTYTDAAQALIEEIRALRHQIPNFTILSKGDGRRLVRAATLPPDFVELAAVAVKNNAALVRGKGADPEQIRDLMSFAQAYRPLADELDALAQFVRHSCLVAKNKAGSEALTTYALAQRLAKRPEYADLAPHIVDMRLALGNRALTRKAKRGTSGVASPTEST